MATTKTTSTRAPRKRVKAAPVETRQMEGKSNWTKEDAAFLVHQGYTPEHAAKVTGFPVVLVTAQYKAGAHRQLASLTQQAT